LLLLFLISMTSNLFSDTGSSTQPSALNDFSLRPTSSHNIQRHTNAHKIPYFVNDRRFSESFGPPSQQGPNERNIKRGGLYGLSGLVSLEENVENYFKNEKLQMCQREREAK